VRGKGHKALKFLKEQVAGKKGESGRPLCVWCQKEVPPRRRNWCSNECVEQYKLQGDWTYLCRVIRKRDKGVCAKCGIDTVALRKKFREMALQLGWKVVQDYAATLNIPKHRVRKRLYDVDHIVPCAEGGRDDPTNLRTLCIPCHRAETTALQQRLAEARKNKNEN